MTNQEIEAEFAKINARLDTLDKLIGYQPLNE